MIEIALAKKIKAEADLKLEFEAIKKTIGLKK